MTFVLIGALGLVLPPPWYNPAVATHACRAPPAIMNANLPRNLKVLRIGHAVGDDRAFQCDNG